MRIARMRIGLARVAALAITIAVIVGTIEPVVVAARAGVVHDAPIADTRATTDRQPTYRDGPSAVPDVVGDEFLSRWRAEGNVQDSLSDQHGAWVGGDAWYETSIFGQAFRFHGGPTWSVSIPLNRWSNPRESQFTAGAWVRFSTQCWDDHVPNSCEQSLLDRMMGNSFVPNVDGWRIYKDNDHRFNFCLGGRDRSGCDPTGPFTVRSATIVDIGTWYWVVGVRTATTFQLWIDGILEAEKPLPNYRDTGNRNLLLGNHDNFYRRSSFIGLMDSILLTNRALPKTEIERYASLPIFSSCPADDDDVPDDTAIVPTNVAEPCAKLPKARLLARRVLAVGDDLRLAGVHPGGYQDITTTADARSNIVRIRDGGRPQRSDYTRIVRCDGWDMERTGFGGDTAIDRRVLGVMLLIADRQAIGIGEMTGGVHCDDSPHYYGRAVDIYTVNGTPTYRENAAEPAIRDVAQICQDPRYLGKAVQETEYLRCEFPRLPYSGFPGWEGGQDSWPSWWNWDSQPPARATEVVTPAGRPDDVPIWKWFNGITDDRTTRPATRVASEALQLGSSLPEAISGTNRVTGQPRDVIGASNATNAVYADYVQKSGEFRVLANVLAFESVRLPYSHDFAVCGRFLGGEVLDIRPITLTVPTGSGTRDAVFWSVRLRDDDGREATATLFSVRIDSAAQVTVDSRWLFDDYGVRDGARYFTYQVSAVDPAIGADLVRSILARFAGQGSVVYDNTLSLTAPDRFVARARFGAGIAYLTVVNRGSVAKRVTLQVMAWAAPNADSLKRLSFERDVPVGRTTLQLPIADLLNGVIYLDDGSGFVDKVYLASGSFYAFTDGHDLGSTVALDSRDCRPVAARPGVLGLPGCVEMTGTVGPGGFIAVGRSFAAGREGARPLREFNALTFFAKGDNRTYRVRLDLDEIAQTGGSDFPEIAFTATPAGRQIVIPLGSLARRTPGDDGFVQTSSVRAIVWLSDVGPAESVRLAVDNIALLRGARPLNTVAERTSDGLVVRTIVTETAGAPDVRLHSSVDGSVFTVTPMRAERGRFITELRDVPAGSEIRYYVSVDDGTGTRVMDPVDAPATTYRIVLGAPSTLVIDEFGDRSYPNLLGLPSFAFGSESGGQLTALFDGRELALRYDTTEPGSFAGYVTSLRGIETGPYNALTFRIRGKAGGERVRVSARSGGDVERKLLAGKYLPGGITTEMRRVVIPLATFPNLRAASLDSVAFIVEHAIGSAAGEITLDDLRLEYLRSIDLFLDSFEDSSGENALSGGYALVKSAGAAASTSAVGRDGGSALRFTFNNPSGADWSVLATDLRGVDLSRARSISLLVRSDQAGLRPKLALVNRGTAKEARRSVDLALYGTIGSSWSRIEVPLTLFNGLDLTNVTELSIAFEGAGSGALEIDDLRFNGIESHQVLLPGARR